jgi:release factor glutamine methyltransferase
MPDPPRHRQWASLQLRTYVIDRLQAAGCVFAEDEARLLLGQASDEAGLEDLVARRASGLPLEQVLGWAEFDGLRILVDPQVFVPRRRTEFLVREAASQVRAPAVVADLCCGSGAIGAALVARLGPIVLYAADLDPAAVRCARRNLTGSRARVYQGDLFAPLPAALRGRIALLTANAPYVPSDEVRLLPSEARLHEALIALDGGADGLSVARRIVAGAPAWLAAAGVLLIETSERQAAQLAEAVAQAGLTALISSDEDSGATVVHGRRPA